jgi:hypothetical protein
MKVKVKLNGDVKITLTSEQVKHVKRILNNSGTLNTGDTDYSEREKTSWELWNKLDDLSSGS